MTVRAYLNAFTGLPKRATFDASEFASLCADIAETFRRPSDHTDPDLITLARTYAQRVRENEWYGATESDVSVLLNAACAGELSEFVPLRDFLLLQAKRTSRQNLLDAMCKGYFEGWEQNDPLTRTVAQLISDQVAFLPVPYSDLTRDVPEILDTSDGPTRLAIRMGQQPAPYQWLLTCGFADPHALGFLTYVSGCFLSSLPAVQGRTAMDRLMEWLCPEGTLGLQGDQQISSINHLLRPWLRTDPSKADQRHLTDFLVRHFDDPRIAGSHIWNLVDPACRGVLLRWLAGDSIVAFMEIISSVELEKPETWQQRREFWTRLYDEGTVSEAWVALHPAAEAEALRRFDKTQDLSLKAFGKQSGKRRDTSLLIMQAGDRIIVEGSHTYRVHIFEENALGRPQLYLGAYFDERITLEKGHLNTRTHDIHGRWREWVRRRLK